MYQRSCLSGYSSCTCCLLMIQPAALIFIFFAHSSSVSRSIYLTSSVAQRRRYLLPSASADDRRSAAPPHASEPKSSFSHSGQHPRACVLCFYWRDLTDPPCQVLPEPYLWWVFSFMVFLQRSHFLQYLPIHSVNMWLCDKIKYPLLNAAKVNQDDTTWCY